MIADGFTHGDAWLACECIAREFRPDIRALNAKSLAYICQAIAHEHPGHLRDRIEELLAYSGIATLLVGPKSLV